MWGVNWPVMKLGLREMSPLYFRALTMTGGFLLLVAYYRFRGYRLSLPAGTFSRVVLLAGAEHPWLARALDFSAFQALAFGPGSPFSAFTMPIWDGDFSACCFFQEKNDAPVVAGHGLCRRSCTVASLA
jgi:hypothetical protein